MTATVSSIHSPTTGEVIDTIPVATSDDIDKAYERAAAGQAEWAALGATARGKVLYDVSRLIEENHEEIARIETHNTGKPIRETLLEAKRGAPVFAYNAGWTDKIFGTTIPVTGNFHTYTTREPFGTIAAVVPWNVPFLFAARKFANGLATGNAVILKPAEESPLSAIRLAELVLKAGVPEGVAQVVTGGRETGAALVAHPGADLISFTGHNVTGQAIARSAADNLTPCILELGGKSAQVVFADADLDNAVEMILFGIFSMTGQMCYAGSRLLVQESIRDELNSRIAQRVAALRVGDPNSPLTQVGPQATRLQQEKTLRMLAQAIDEGATVAAQAAVPTDPALSNGFFTPPTFLVDVDESMTIAREEVFGPVLASSTFTDEADALRLANSTDFGLAAGVWTSDVGRAHRVAEAINAGNVWINTYRIVSDLVPFGGNGASGYGRESGLEGLLQLTRTKSVWTSTAPGLPPGYVF